VSAAGVIEGTATAADTPPAPLTRRAIVEAAAVFLLSLALLIPFLGQLGFGVYDEVLYAPQAKALWQGTRENIDHPPLAKYLLGAGAKLVGDNAIGWRIMPVLFGSLTMAIVFLWLWPMGRRTAWLGVALMAFNGFWYPMSRIAMIIIFELTFAVLGLYLLQRRSYWLAGAALGLAMACRWNAAFALLLALVYAACDRRIVASLKVLLSSAVAYVLAWLPFTGLHAGRFINAQLYILHFHLHADGNPILNDRWYHWIFQTRPFAPIGHMIANPIIGALGVISVTVLVRRRNLAGIAALVFLLQWAITPRPYTYYYYYLDCFTMMTIATAMVIAPLRWNLGGREIRPAPWVAIFSGLWFVVHFPVFAYLQAPYDTLFGALFRF
jgi:4-amino-4-deoxy-L-arabinose transferase-like glycosyltransferase